MIPYLLILTAILAVLLMFEGKLTMRLAQEIQELKRSDFAKTQASRQIDYLSRQIDLGK